ncbi:MAG: hypothetical protein ACKVOJ_04935 [Sphingomonadaceae bacterium]
MPLHYALTDALVALVAAWGAWQMQQSRQPVAVFGFALFALAGLIGTVRITSGQIEQMAMLHKMASQLGGLAGLVLLLSQIVRKQLWSHTPTASMLAAVVALAIAAIAPAIGAALFIAMLLVALTLLLKARAFVGAAGFALMLLGAILVRQSGILGPDISWHAYHVIVAIWLFCTAMCLRAGKLSGA